MTSSPIITRSRAELTVPGIEAAGVGTYVRGGEAQVLHVFVGEF